MSGAFSLDWLLEREWLETNGIGGFASCTLAGINTRRYHGLLTVALQPPVARHLLLSKLEETLIVGGARFDLCANLYPGTVHPSGFEYLTGFRLDPFPTFTWNAGGVEVEKTVFMPHGENTVVVEYTIHGDNGEALLELRPLIAFRDYHSTTHQNPSLNPACTVSDGSVSVQPYATLPALHFAHNAVSVERTGDWYLNFQFPVERQRGLDASEDLFQPFLLRFSGAATVIASLDPRDAQDAPILRRIELVRRAQFQSTLHKAADQFLVSRGSSSHTVIAGYHWFTDWGRDTMISLPGLTLATKRFDIARDILRTFARSVDGGMLPNRFPDSGEAPEYNTADASLWFFEAVQKYIDATGDRGFVENELRAALSSIVEWHLRGTRCDIQCHADGLLHAGSPSTQLTWMDARVHGIPVTPRFGKPVEIQALWYNALSILGEKRRAEAAKVSFHDLFWNASAGCLYDCLSDGRPDPSIRPNQVLALSLSHPIVTDAARARSILGAVMKHLLTPYGLRTLAPCDPAYRPRCTGSPEDRDSAYHQGTVWPWLMGPFTSACERFGVVPPSLEPLREHLSTAGLGTISEVFDGDPPHTPRGCIAQAWSVAEFLRLTL